MMTLGLIDCGKDGGFRVGTCNIDSQTGRAGEVVEALLYLEKLMRHAFKKHDGKVVVVKFSGAKRKRYKLFWMGGEERLDGVGILVAEKWVDSVVRHSKRVLILKMVSDNGLLNVLTVCMLRTQGNRRRKNSFWNEVFHLVSCIPQNETVV